MSAPGPGYSVLIPTVALVSATAKTGVLVVAGANSPFSVVEFGVSCDGAAGNLLVEMFLNSGGEGEEGAEITPTLMRGVASAKPTFKALAKAAAGAWKAEPAAIVVLKKWRIPLPMAPLILPAALGREAGATTVTAATAGKGWGLRLTPSTGTPNFDGYVEIEE